jgi:predicted transposase YbfD/YdcC
VGPEGSKGVSIRDLGREHWQEMKSNHPVLESAACLASLRNRRRQRETVRSGGR